MHKDKEKCGLVVHDFHRRGLGRTINEYYYIFNEKGDIECFKYQKNAKGMPEPIKYSDYLKAESRI